MCLHTYINIFTYIYIYISCNPTKRRPPEARQNGAPHLLQAKSGKKKSGRCQNPYYYNDDCPYLMDCILYDNRL